MGVCASRVEIEWKLTQELLKDLRRIKMAYSKSGQPRLVNVPKISANRHITAPVMPIG